MAKSSQIELADGETIPILHEDRAVLVIDKPRGWMLAPADWQKTSRNLQAALLSSMRAGDFWARSRNLKFLRFVHRLDAGTSGVLLLAKSPGALSAFSGLFESRAMEKVYLAAVVGLPETASWTCRLKLVSDRSKAGRTRVDPANGKEAETHFRVLQANGHLTLIEARPLTGRTHQIRVHLAAAGHPVAGDTLYGKPDQKGNLGLRAVGLSYQDPFTGSRVEIRAPEAGFLQEFGFQVPEKQTRSKAAVERNHPGPSGLAKSS